MIDPKPVWVPVPTWWQRIMYFVWKICSVVVGVAVCVTVTYALNTLAHDAKWGMRVNFFVGHLLNLTLQPLLFHQSSGFVVSFVSVVFIQDVLLGSL